MLNSAPFSLSGSTTGILVRLRQLFFSRWGAWTTKFTTCHSLRVPPEWRIPGLLIWFPSRLWYPSTYKVLTRVPGVPNEDSLDDS